MSWIRSYSCITAAGENTDELWNALASGRDVSQPFAKSPEVRACLFQGHRKETSRQLLMSKMAASFAPIAEHLRRDRPFGVIFASTKGFIDDFVWSADSEHVAEDPLAPLLTDFLNHFALQPERALCVSNACSSALAAMALGQRWLTQGMEQVLIVSADAVTPFVIKGFQALKLISPSGIRPFSGDRTGFYLGEAAACLLLEREPTTDALFLRPVGMDGEGSAVTRPSVSGDSVVRAALAVPNLRDSSPEVVIAHGTGTVINDATEDLAFTRLFQELPNPPLITGSKWCTGHTLAVSGALDAILACEALKRQQLFRLATTAVVDSKFHSRYATQTAALPNDFSRVLISSLGFGGMHASALIERAP
jgi:Beta-ketoacyl synthase, C-terminal domain/Beta-ketoacyl synthase, N-terminal domain